MKLTEKQKEIIELAKRMFSTKGYVETSMRDLAFQLDIKAASIYAHFRSKEEILLLICDEIYENMSANMKIIGEMEGNAKDRFLHYIKLHITSIIKNQKSFEIYYKYWNLLDGKYAGKYGLMNYQYFDFIKQLVKESFPKSDNLVCYKKDAATLFMVDLLNAIPKLVNPENPDLDMVVEDVQMRLMYGFSKDSGGF